MSATKGLITKTILSGIADAIRAKLGVQTQYKPTQMADAIASIVTATLQSKTITPSASQQTVQPDSGYDGLSSVVVNGDVDLVAGNIKKNVEIFGVTGSYEGGSGGILTGRDAPSASLGNDGDVYKQEIPIPSNVNFVEYLECSGTQYINTGIYATQDIDAVVAGDRRSGSSNAACMLGVRTGNFSGMTKTLYFGSHSDNSTAVSAIKTGSSASGSITSSPAGEITRRTKTIKDNNGYYIYCALIDEVPTYNKLYRQTGTWRSDMPLCMFAYYQGTTLTIGGSTRNKRVTIFDKGAPIADYLPCLDGNGVACMWDNVAQEYVYNDGTGDFSYGSALADLPAALDPVLWYKDSGTWKVIGFDV